MAETISKHIGEGFGKGELFAALSYDASDSFGGMKIKNVMFNSTGKAYFLDANAYIYASSSGVLELTATTINLNGAFSFTGTDTIALGTSATPLVLTAGSPIFTLYSTDSNTTTTNSQAFLVKQVVTGIGGYGGRALFHTYSNVASGTNLKALRCFTEFGVAGSATGLASGLGVELKMPNATPAGAASYTVLQLDYVAGGTSTVTTGSLSGRNASFIKASNSGDADGDFDDNGFLLFLAGLTDGTGHLLYNNTLRIGVGTTAWYLPMSSAEGSFTTAYPIVTSNATAIDFTGTVTKGLDFADAVLAFNQENAYLAIGTWSAAKTITGQTDHYVPIQVNLLSSTSVAKDIAAARFRVNTGAANTLTAVNVLELRSQLAHDVAQHTVVQASTTVSAAVEVQSGEALVAYFAFDGAGAMTSVAGNPNIAIAEFKLNNTGTTLSDMCILESVVSSTATNMLRLQTAGTVTSMIKFVTASGATVTNLFEIVDQATDLITAYTSEEAPTGKIKININGATRYIAYWD